MPENSIKTIKELYKEKKLSVRSYNALLYAELLSVDAIRNYVNSGNSLLTIKHLGRKSLMETQAILDEYEPFYNNLESALTGTGIEPIISDCYAHMLAECNDANVKGYFDSNYPNPMVMYENILTERISFYNIRFALSQSENLKFRKAILVFINKIHDKFIDKGYVQTGICRTINAIKNALAPKVDKFTSYEIFQLLPLERKEYVDDVYSELLDRLGTRTKNITSYRHVSLGDILQAIDDFDHFLRKIGINPNSKVALEYRDLCDEMKMEVLNSKFVDIDELQKKQYYKKYFKFSKKLETRVIRYVTDYCHYPCFLLAKDYYRKSIDKKDNIYNSYYGITDGEDKKIDEVAEIYNLSRERVRQIMIQVPEAANIIALKYDDAVYYKTLFAKSHLFSNDSEYLRICQEEGVELSFKAFGGLLHVFNDDFIYENVEGIEVISHKDILWKINLSKLFKKLQYRIGLQRVVNEIIDLKDFFDITCIDKEYRQDTITLIKEIALRLNINVNSDFTLELGKNALSIPLACVEILQSYGREMSLEELLYALLRKHPDCGVTTPNKLGTYFKKDGPLRPLGKRGVYVLREWEGDFVESTLDAVVKTLKENVEPMTSMNISEKVQTYFPGAIDRRIRDILNSHKDIFKRTDDGRFCLVSSAGTSNTTVKKTSKLYTQSSKELQEAVVAGLEDVLDFS